MNDTPQNNTATMLSAIMPSVVFYLSLCCVSRLIYQHAECRYTECHYADCRQAECDYAECRYDECCGANLSVYNDPSLSFRKKSLSIFFLQNHILYSYYVLPSIGSNITM